MADIRTLEDELNGMILQGKILEAFDRFYADDVVMQENGNEPTRGAEANRAREVEFLNSVEEFHNAEVRASAVNGDTSLSEWMMDVTFKEGGRVTMEQATVRRWRDGKVASERFYYNQG